MDLNSFLAIMNINIGGNSVQDYLQALLVFFVLYFGLSLVHRVVVRRLEKISKKTATDIDDLLVSILSRLGRSFFLVIALYMSTMFLKMPPNLSLFLRALLIIVITIRVTVLAQEALRYGIKHTYLRRKKVKEDPTVDSAVNSIIGVLRWFIWLGAVLFLLDNLGVNITTMVASIGITGIAVGIALQAILGDMFSAFAIFLDKPFEVGDFVIVDNYMGTIEQIGIKTTRIRSLSGEQLIFANSDLTKSRIKNYKLLEEPRGAVTFTIAFNTPGEKLREISETVIKTIRETPDVRLDHVHLRNFGPSGYDYEAAFYILRGNVGRNFDLQEITFIRIAECLQQIGVVPVAQARDITITNLPKERNPI